MKKFLLSIFAVMLAVFSVQAQNYVKVTSAPADWSGDYLIVYEAGNVAFNGSLTTLDAANNNVEVVINGDNIAATDATNAIKFTITKSETSYTIKSASGYYIGNTADSNKLYSNKSTKYNNTISLNNDGTVQIVGSGGSVLRYNANSGNYRFRYYKSSSYTNQKAIALYKYTEEGAGEETPTVPGAPVLPEEQTFRGSMEVAITGIADGVTVYYTTDGTEPSESNGEAYAAPFEITATTTVKAVAVNEVGASEVVTKIYTLFVVEETEGYYIKVVSEPTDWSGKYLVVYEEGADAYVFNGKDENFGYVSATTDGDVIKANSEVDAVAVTVAAMDGGYSVKTAAGYIYGQVGSNALKFGDTGQANTIAFVVGEGVKIISNTSVLRFNSASNNMRFRYYKSDTYADQQPVQLYKYVESLPLYHSLTVTDAKYATLYLAFNARIPSTVEAYTVTKVNDGWVSLTQVTGVIPSQTGIIVKAAAGDYKFFMGETVTADVEGNLLEGTLFNAYIEEEAYVLGKVDDVVGLYLAEMTDGAWLNNANKAYLPAPAGSNIAAYSFRFGEGTTGIENVTTENVNVTVIYDLTGRRVEAITAPGIYVVNGKKVLVK